MKINRKRKEKTENENIKHIINKRERKNEMMNSRKR